MKIIIGLGNPGMRYKNTRHNVGFRVLDQIAKEYKFSIKKKGYQGIYGVAKIENSQAMLFKPLTYMNLSGEAVQALCSSKLKDKNDLLVITDDVNLEIGVLRLKDKGSSGGHNGLKSIIEQMGQDFARLRIGVGGKPEEADLSSHVLSSFSREDRKIVDETIEKAAECAAIWI